MFLIDRCNVKNWLSTGYASITLHANCSLGQRQLIVGNTGSGRTTLLSNIGINSSLDSYYSYLNCSFNLFFYNLVGSSRREFVYLKFLHKVLNKKFNYFIDSTISLDLYSQLSLPFNVSRSCLTLCLSGISSIHILDSLTNHAKLYRTFMLGLKRSPGREAFPGDVFYLHSSLLENYGQFNLFFNSRSVTALPVSTIFNNDVSDYITTNLISITDGQWFLSKSLKLRSLFPSFDINLSVSRLGSSSHPSLLKVLASKFKKVILSFLLLEDRKLSSGLTFTDKLFIKRGFNFYSFYFYKRGLSFGSLLINLLLFLLVEGFTYCSISCKKSLSLLYFAKYGLNKLIPSLFWLLNSYSSFNNSIIINYSSFLFKFNV